MNRVRQILSDLAGNAARVRQSTCFVPAVMVLTCFIVTIVWWVWLPRAALAQAAGACGGPADLCQQLSDLQQQLTVARQQQGGSLSMASGVRLLGGAGTEAVLLKVAISMLRGWSPFFKTDRSDAVVRMITIVAGLLVGVLTHVAGGVPWWQSVIVMAGGPGAVAFHELWKLIPVAEGKEKMPPDEKDPPPSNAAPKAAA